MAKHAIPKWITNLTSAVRKSGLPSAVLADAMRKRGEDPRDKELWNIRIRQLDIALFGCPVEELRKNADQV